MLFQSSPARGGGCNLRCEPQQGTPQIVSILTRPWGRVQRQSMLEQARQLRVSILTRPWGRVQPVSVSPCRIHSALFQSSPARGGGCNIVHLHQKAGWGCFNPHPPVGAGATEKLERLLSSESCCFNPHPPVGAGATQGIQLLNRQYTVSILTRPWGRVQQTAASVLVDPEMFQSSPARGGGCNAANQAAADAAECAVSILTRPWGRVQHKRACRGFRSSRDVSILTRPWGRVQPQRAIAISSAGASFNPHPPVGAGATRTARPWAAAPAGFNPHPPVGAGATCGASPNKARHRLFQSSPARGGGCSPRCSCCRMCRAACFNPHPPVGAGATDGLRVRCKLVTPFQSSPARGGGCNAAWRTRGSGSPNASVPVVKVCRAALWAANGWAFAYGHKVCSVTPLGGLPTCTE
jgi:hypothetical protein